MLIPTHQTIDCTPQFHLPSEDGHLTTETPNEVLIERFEYRDWCIFNSRGSKQLKTEESLKTYSKPWTYYKFQ